MDTRTGEIAPLDVFRERLTPAEFDKFVREIDVNNLPPEARREFSRTSRGKISRNSPCPCGSQKKFKRCCQYLLQS